MYFKDFRLLLLFIVPLLVRAQEDAISKEWGSYVQMEVAENIHGFTTDNNQNLYFISGAGGFHKLSPDGFPTWSVNVPKTSFYAIEIDSHNNIYLSGYTKSLIDISTSNTFQPVIVDTMRGSNFLMKYDSEGTKIWGTYFGNEIETNFYENGYNYSFSQGQDIHYYSDILVDINGRVVKETTLNQQRNQIKINNISKGIYFLNITSPQHKYRNMKIVILE